MGKSRKEEATRILVGHAQEEKPHGASNPIKEALKKNVKEFFSRLSLNRTSLTDYSSTRFPEKSCEKYCEKPSEAKTMDPGSDDGEDYVSSFVSEVRDDVQFASEQQLTGALFRSCINVNLFGTNQAKTMRDLFWEIQKRECEMRWANGKLERHVQLMKIYLYFDTRKERRVLIEKSQQIGPRRRDLSNLNYPIVKNIYFDEQPDEEDYQELTLHNLLGLSIKDQRKHLRFIRRVERFEGPYTDVEYPGLKTHAKVIERHVKIKDVATMASSCCCELGLPSQEGAVNQKPTRPFTFDEEAVPLWKRHFWAWVDVSKDKSLADVLKESTYGQNSEAPPPPPIW